MKIPTICLTLLLSLASCSSKTAQEACAQFETAGQLDKCRPLSEPPIKGATAYTARSSGTKTWVQVYSFEDSAKMLEGFELVRSDDTNWTIINESERIVVVGFGPSLTEKEKGAMTETLRAL